MNILLKHYLNTVFAFVLAIGVERLFHVLDPVMRETQGAAPDLTRFWAPLVLVLFTLFVCGFAATSNERLVEHEKSTVAYGPRACLMYGSVLCMVIMFFFSVDFDRVVYWTFTYAALCIINAAWNRIAVQDRRARTLRNESRVVLLHEGHGPAQRMVEVLKEHDVPVRFSESLDVEPERGLVHVTTATLEHGFVDEGALPGGPDR